MRKKLAVLALLVLSIPAILYAQASGAQLNGTGANGNVLMRDTASGAGWSWQTAYNLNTQGGVPTGSASTCGTTPTITGNNSLGSVTLTAGLTLPCTIVFSQAWPTAPKCFVNPEVLTTATTTARATGITTAQFVITTTAALVATDKVSWHCLSN